MSGARGKGGSVVRFLRFLAHLMADGWTVPAGLAVAAVVTLGADRVSSTAAQALMLAGLSITLLLAVRSSARQAVRGSGR
ncbi:MAG: hypothetical protein M0Z87_01570 [Actinomycetota bacterium]|nr:hypothetical protein [Actinomycetota bacterium]